MVIDRRPFAALALALALPALLAAPAQAIVQSDAAALHAGTVEVPLNKSQVVSADRPIAKAMIGNADIADVLPVTDRSVYVLGKKMGTTSLTLYDSGGRVMSVVDVAVGPDIQALTDQIHELIPGENIQARISNDSIVLTGMVDSAGASDRAAQLAQAFAASKVINLISLGSSQQVMLEVRFAEVDRTAEKDFGISTAAQGNNGKFASVTGSGASASGSGVNLLQLAPITGMFGVFAKSFGLGGLNINATLNALENRGLAKTLAEPTLVSLSGERASFLAGGEFPIPVAQNGTGTAATITVEFKPFGVGLSFTPTVLGDKTISLVVEPEVSEIDPSASLTLNNITIPGLRTRRASTTLQMRDGESFAIAGLLQRDFKTTVDQLPVLGSIPIIGSLFRSSNFQRDQTELLIVVTPHLVAPIRQDQVRLPTDRVADPRESDTFLLGQAYRPQKVDPNGAPLAAKAADPKSKEDHYAY